MPEGIGNPAPPSAITPYPRRTSATAFLATGDPMNGLFLLLLVLLGGVGFFL